MGLYSTTFATTICNDAVLQKVISGKDYVFLSSELPLTEQLSVIDLVSLITFTRSVILILLIFQSLSF